MSLAWHTSRLYRWFIDWITAIGMPMHLNLPWWLADSPVSFYRLFFIVITGTLLGLFVYVFLRMAGKLAGDSWLTVLSRSSAGAYFWDCAGSVFPFGRNMASAWHGRLLLKQSS